MTIRLSWWISCWLSAYILSIIAVSPAFANECDVYGVSYGKNNSNGLTSKFRKSVFAIKNNSAIGTGFLIANGIALTAKHTVGTKGQKVQVRFPEADYPGPYDAYVLDVHPKLDLAILRVKGIKGRLANLEIFTEDEFPTVAPIRQYGYGGASFEQAKMSVGRLGTINGSRNGPEVSYESNEGDSGGPIVIIDSQLVAGLHTGRVSSSVRRDFIPLNSDEIILWLARKIPEDIVEHQLNALLDGDGPDVRRALRPSECDLGQCLRSTILLAITMKILADFRKNQDEITFGKKRENRIKCELLYTLKVRNLSSAHAELYHELGIKTVDLGRQYFKQAELLSKTIVESDSSNKNAKEMRDKIADLFVSASNLLALSAVENLLEDGSRSSGRLCGTGAYTPKAAKHLYAHTLQNLIGVRDASEMLSNVDFPECNNTYYNDTAAARFFDAAVALQRATSLDTNRTSLTEQRVAAGLAATASIYARNTTRRKSALLEMSAALADLDPFLAARASASAYYLGGQTSRAKDNYLSLTSSSSENQFSTRSALPKNIAFAEPFTTGDFGRLIGILSGSSEAIIN